MTKIFCPVRYSFSLIIGVLICGYFTGCKSSKENSECAGKVCWENLIRDHLDKYPEMQVADLYKLLYQATLGNGHAVTDSAAAGEWLGRDLADLSTDKAATMADTLGTCGRFARVHLKPYLDSGGTNENIVRFFMETANQYKPDSTAFFCALSAAIELAENGSLPWTGYSVKEFLKIQSENRYPAVHHTEKFTSAYHPHYRIIAVELLPGLLRKN